MPSRRRLSALAWRYGNRLRWLLVGLCLALAAASAASAPGVAEQRSITVAARAVSSGATIEPADLAATTATLPVATLAVEELVGEVARGPLEAGEPITASRIVPGGAIPPPDGRLVFPLPLSDQRIAALLHSGDRIDVLVTPDALHEGEPRLVARDVEVLAVTGQEESAFGPASTTTGAVVLVAVAEAEATALAAIRGGDHVSVTIR